MAEECRKKTQKPKPTQGEAAALARPEHRFPLGSATSPARPLSPSLGLGQEGNRSLGWEIHAGGQDEGGKAAGSEAPGPGGVSLAPLAASPWSRPWHRHVPRSRSAAAAQTGNPPAAPSRWPLPPPCWGGGETAVRTGPCPPHPQHQAPRDPAPSPGCGARDARGQRASGLGGLQGWGWARPAAGGWGRARPAHSGARHCGVGAVFHARQGPGSVPRLVGIGLLYKGKQCCGCSFAAEPRSWQDLGASKLDNNCSHLLAHLRRGWEQRVPAPACRRACYGKDGEIWLRGEAGIGIPATRG